MSSDESATENGVKQFRILKKGWRNEQLTPWLRVFDGIAREKRINPVTETSRGAEARQRFQSGKIDNSSPAVSHLPHNAYNPVWYEALTPYRQRRLKARKKAYKFTHTPGIEMYVVLRIIFTHDELNIGIHSQANDNDGRHIEGRAARFR